MRELDVRLANARIEQRARWWTSASEKARYEALRQAIHGDQATFEEIRLAIILAETAAGEVEEG